MTTDFERYTANAIEWAMRHLDSTEYALRCLAFVEDAYERSNGIEMFGGSSAKESAEEYEASHNPTPPPMGAFAFYDCVGLIDGERKNWGHVGLCVGEGKLVHAWDKVRVDHYLAMEELPPAPGWTAPVYVGWVPVERLLQGYRVKVYK